MAQAKSKTWIWHFDAPAEAIWTLMGDTARFNEAANIPRHSIESILQPDGSTRFLAHVKFGPLRLDWREQPVNWVHRQWFEHCRHFENGPLLFLCARMTLIPQPGGCRCEYTVEVAPRNMLGRLMLATGFFPQIGRTFTPLAKTANDHAGGRRDTPFDIKTPKLASGARARAKRFVERIKESPHGHELASRLADFVLTRQEVDVWAIRPLQLARIWDVPERHAIELCLEAAKQGLLRLRWDLLCPRCQVGKGSVFALDELPTGTHCDSCNIDYRRDYSNNIELVFQPGAAIRPIEAGEYCLFGPMSTPHIMLHLTLEPGERRRVPVHLEHGRYRFRTLEPGGEADIEWAGGGFPAIIADGTSVLAGAPAEPGQVILQNDADHALTLIIEERMWTRDALTAKRATALQAFRDLFTEEILRPGDDVEIDNITIMFTDLKGSTALYERIGDPRAYHLVREHFAILGHAVRQNDGVLVKTIGDAIMAAFIDPVDALNCAVHIQTDFASFNHGRPAEPVVVKIGLHSGRCISVTLNGRLDYYGTAANKAARLESQSEGGDIVLSPEYASDPQVAEALSIFALREEQTVFKGYDEPVRYLRITEEELRENRGDAI